MSVAVMVAAATEAKMVASNAVCFGGNDIGIGSSSGTASEANGGAELQKINMKNEDISGERNG